MHASQLQHTIIGPLSVMQLSLRISAPANNAHSTKALTTRACVSSAGPFPWPGTDVQPRVSRSPPLRMPRMLKDVTLTCAHDSGPAWRAAGRSVIHVSRCAGPAGPTRSAAVASPRATRHWRSVSCCAANSRAASSSRSASSRLSTAARCTLSCDAFAVSERCVRFGQETVRALASSGPPKWRRRVYGLATR